MNLAFAAVVAACVGLECPLPAPFYDPLTNEGLTLREQSGSRSTPGAVRRWPLPGERAASGSVETRHSRLLAPRERILGALMWRWRTPSETGPETTVLLVAATGSLQAEFVSVGFYEGSGRGIVAGPLQRVVMPATRGIDALPPDPEAQVLRFGDLWAEDLPESY